MQAELIYDKRYRLWRNGEYLGTAFWTKDDNVGDSFQKKIVDENGQIVNKVFVVDKWEPVE